MHSSTNARPKPRSRAHPGPNSNPVGGGAVFPVATSYPSMKAGVVYGDGKMLPPPCRVNSAH